MATFSQQFDADHRTLSTLRGALLEWLGHESATVALPDALVGDVDLVVTELAANVIDHSQSPWVQVAVRTTSSGLLIEVSQLGEALGLPETEVWDAIAAEDRGHGLRIVRALCDEITIRRDGEAAMIRCRMIS